MVIDFSLYADLIGKPYQDGARGPMEYDCVGLLMVMQRRLGHPVPDWTSDPEEVQRAMELFHTITDPHPGDCVLLRTPDPGWHVGVMVTHDRMLHARRGTGCVVESLARDPWRRRVEGYFRWAT